MSDDTATGPITVAVSSSFDQTQPLSDAVHILPSHAVKHLLSAGVCRRCISRLFGIRGDEESTQSLLFEESELCRICLGILQFTYGDNSAKMVKKEDANDFALSIAELVKREGYELDGFSLEVSIPPVILENDRLLWLYLKKKYGSEPWFQENLNVGILVKDALKSAIANPVEHLLDVKSSSTSCRIRLTYTQTNPVSTPPDSVGRNEGSKRRKTDTNNGFDAATKVLVGANTECFGAYTVQEIAVSDICSNGLEENGSSDSFNFPLERVNEPCHLELLCYRTPIFFGGRYLKFSRNVSQSRWIIDDERMGEASVEEIVGGNILPACKGDAYKFHAAGREDIDVRMLGSGRPFLVEIQNARQVPSEAVVKEIETKINNMENRLVGVTNLKLVNDKGWAMMREGEAEKQKQYCAVVWISRLLEDEDLQTIASFKDMQILQRTPIRVLHRRSPLERDKTIHWMKIERICGSSQYFLLHLCTQAGTYIKEFVHGDLGRTQPSIGSILGCRAEILQLDVTDVKMDCFMA